MDVSRGRIVRAGRVVVGVALANFVTGCRDATSIELLISTDLPCEQVRVVTTSIGSGSLETYESRPPGAVTTRCDDTTGYIGSLVLLPNAQDHDTEIAIRVVTARSNKAPEECRSGTSAECIVARRVVRFVPNRLVTLPIRMQNVCSGVVCGPTQTCNAGHCVSALVSIATCPPEGCEARLDDEPPNVTDAGVGVPNPPAPSGTADASAAPADAGLAPDAALAPVDAGGKKKPPKGGKDEGDNGSSNSTGNTIDAGQGSGGVIAFDASVSPDIVGPSDAGASNDDDDDDDDNGNGNGKKPNKNPK